MGRIEILQGNHIVAEAALAAGCDFYGGYPITPSSEVAQYMSVHMPRTGNIFIQMEDEISSLGACIGAALTGRKAMTATSGPGISLMNEHIGMAAMIEVPVVILNVMRGGPSTGLPTKPSQSDIMQARWGSHGDYPIIALYPALASEIFDETVRAFNLAQKYMTPVIILMDEVLGKVLEDVSLPDAKDIEIYDKKAKPPVDLNVYDRELGELPARVDFFEGYPINIESLEHERHGWPTIEPDIVDKMQKLRMEKIYMHLDDIVKYKAVMLDDADIMIFAAGVSARAAEETVVNMRKQGVKVGLFKPLTIWPFPEEPLKKYFGRIKKVLTVELNMGQLKYEIERTAGPHGVDAKALLRATGIPFTPQKIEEEIRRVFKV
ncbi:MAG: 2-oxoacid:acceptor oxidoreductase subunit alpha [Oscillospiraceae bacterium]|nr:2-oxoacid:acceptor oxidoreductase subunit alpha [Oscillospiraceae bacterium]